MTPFQYFNRTLLFSFSKTFLSQFERKHTEYQHYRFGFWLSLTEIRVLIIDKIQVLQLKATSKDYTFRSNKKNSLNLLFQDDI